MYISVCWTHSDSVMVLSLQSRSMSNSILLECILLHICSSVWNFLNSKKITHHPKNPSFYMQHALLKRWWFTYPPHSKHHTTRNNDIWRYLKAVFNLNSCTHVNTILLQTRFGRCRYGTRIRRKWNGAEVERGLQLFFLHQNMELMEFYMCIYV